MTPNWIDPIGIRSSWVSTSNRGINPSAEKVRADRRMSPLTPNSCHMVPLGAAGGKSVSPFAPRDDARSRARPHPHGMAVIAADRQDGAVAQDLYDLEDMMRHHADDPRSRTAGGSAPMRPVAREIVFGPRISADQLTHFPPAPCGRASIGGVMRRTVSTRNVLVMMKMMATRSCTRCTRRCRQKGRGKQTDKTYSHYALPHYALQCVGTAVRPSWFEAFVGKRAV
jgi:hypothetical protein